MYRRVGMIITPGTVIDKFMEFAKEGYNNKWVNKPLSWALYETWKWADEREKPRKRD